jgi:hypothetical protein
MDKYQIVKDQSNQRSWDFLIVNDTELKTCQLYLPLKALLENRMNLITVAKQKQFEQTGYITTDKGYHKNLVGNTIWKFANRGSSQAFILNKPDLSAALNKPISFIMRGKDSEVYGKSNDLYLLMKQNESTLTEIKADDFTEMEGVLKDYNDILNAPKEEIKEKKTEGTDPIPGLLDEVDVIKDHLGKMIQSYFAHLYSKWVEIIKVGSPLGMRKTSMVVLLTEDITKVILRKVKVTLVKGDATYVKYSSKKGYVRYYSLEPGNYTLKAEYDFYTSFEKADIGIDEKHIEKMTVALKKVDATEPDPETTTGILSLIAYDKETGEPLAGAINSIPALNHSNTTDEDGEDYADEAEPGNYQGTLFFDGKKPLNYNFTIEPGKTTILKLYMENEE